MVWEAMTAQDNLANNYMGGSGVYNKRGIRQYIANVQVCGDDNVLIILICLILRVMCW